MTALLLLPIAASAGGCATHATPQHPTAAQLEGLRRIAVVVEGDGAFEVVSERARGSSQNLARAASSASMAGAGGVLALPVVLALAGVIAAAESELARSADEQAAGRMASHVAPISPRAAIGEAFTQALRADGRFADVRVLAAEPTGDDRRAFDAVVALQCPRWGFQVLDIGRGPRDGNLTAFVEVRVRMTLPERGVRAWEEGEIILGGGRHAPAALTADPAVARRELTDLFERAGHRLAAGLLYPRAAVP